MSPDVYVVVVAAAPAMLALHRRFGLSVPLVLVAAAVLTDIARLALGISFVGVGFFYADGSLMRSGRRVAALLAAGGLLA